jgi:preprotein translocase subunit SecA
VGNIDHEIAQRIYKIQIVPQQRENTQTATASTSSSAAPTVSQVVTKSQEKIGRNDPCPCGSGLKYKKCGLVNSATHQEKTAQAKA